MTLLQQIQDGAADGDVSLSMLLRKCKILGARMGSGTLEDWVEHELNGYSESVIVPSYRVVPLILVGDFENMLIRRQNAHIPPSCVPEIDKTEVRRSVSSIEHLLASSDGKMFRISMGDLPIVLSNKVFAGMQCIDAWGEAGGDALSQILNAVRNRVLDLSLQLWKASPEIGEIGAGVPEAVEQRATQIITNIIYGNANIVGAAHNAELKLIVNQGDVVSLTRALADNGVGQSELAELKLALEKDGPPPQGGKGFGARVNAWRDMMIAKAQDGSWQIGVGVAIDLLDKVLSQFFGLSG